MGRKKEDMKEETLFGTIDKTQQAIDRLRHFEPSDGFHVAISGGKDSSIIYSLVKKSGCKAKYFHALTTIDPPHVIWHIRKHMPDVEIMRPAKPFFQRMIEKGVLPMRIKRWCCEEYKENWGKNKFVVTGVRSGESRNRSGRPMFHNCIKSGRQTLNVIVDWSDSDVWEYIRENSILVNELYLPPYNYERVGCVLCPMVRDVERQKKDFPVLFENWHRAVIKMFEKGISEGKKIRFESGEALWQWWLNRDSEPENKEQTSLFAALAQHATPALRLQGQAPSAQTEETKIIESSAS